MRRIVRALLAIGVVGGSAGWAGAASAQPVVVTNLGQAGMTSTVPQPPETLVSRGTCPEARTLGEANGEPSPCPPGTWPVPGTAWGPAVETVRGDVLALDFAAAPDDVRITLTSNHPIGLTTPPTPGGGPGAPSRPGEPVPNVAYGPATATPSPDDPRRWLVTVPDSGRPAWSRTPMYAAIASRTGSTGDDHVLELTAGRLVQYGSDCGAIWLEPGPPTPYCPRDVVPPGIPTPDRSQPGAGPTTTGTPSARRPQARPVRTGRPAVRTTGRGLRITVPGATRGTLRVSVSWRGRTLGTSRRTVPAARTVAVDLPLRAALRRRLRAARPATLRVVTRASVAGSTAVAVRSTSVVVRGR